VASSLATWTTTHHVQVRLHVLTRTRGVSQAPDDSVQLAGGRAFFPLTAGAPKRRAAPTDALPVRTRVLLRLYDVVYGVRLCATEVPSSCVCFVA
jgi:hypothetical protein